MPIDLSVYLVSKDRPDKLRATLELVIRAAGTAQNYDFELILDDGQQGLYAEVLRDYPTIRLHTIPPGKSGMRRCFQKALDVFIDERDSRFFLVLPDDVYGVVDQWTARIGACRDRFKDGVFALYSGSPQWGRTPEISESCYLIPYHNPAMERVFQSATRFPGLSLADPLNVDFVAVYEFCELGPILARGLARGVRAAYANSNHDLSYDFITGFLLQQICRQTGEQRNVRFGPDGFRVVNDYTNDAGARMGYPDPRVLKQIASSLMAPT